MTTETAQRNLGRYSLLEKIGAGGMGQVYLARDEVLGRRVAVKMLTDDPQDSPQASAMFSQEARLLAQLVHPNVITIHDFGQTDAGEPFFVMEYLEYPNLHRFLKAKKTVPWEESLDLVAGICRGLEAAHEQGVLHLDLKPANVLVGGGAQGIWDVRLLDFGVSQLIKHCKQPTLPEGPSTGQSTIVGTPRYVSPESIEGSAPDRRVDLYALGVIWYEMLLGVPPFVAKDMKELFRIKLTQDPLRFSEQMRGIEVPAEVEALVFELMDRDRERRPANAWVVLERLEKIARKHDKAPGMNMTPGLHHPDMLVLEPADQDAESGATRQIDTRKPRATVRSDEQTFRSEVSKSTLRPEPTPIPKLRPKASPQPMSSTLIGREEDMELLLTVVAEESSLVTLVGPGGVGKSILAESFVQEQSDAAGFDRVIVTDVAAAESATTLLADIARAAGCDCRGGEPIREIGRHCASFQAPLLVMDNLEHVVVEAGDVIGQLLQEAPNLKVLATSRSSLRLGFEQVFSVNPFPSVPSSGLSWEEIEALPDVRLFVHHAQRANKRFKLSEGSSQVILDIIRKLDGLPLAIELAASRTKLRSLESLSARLEETLDVLKSGRRDVPKRQATLRATFDWSWDLLTDGERCMLAQAAVFSGGFTLDAAEEVVQLPESADSDELEEIIESLCEHSLLVVHGPTEFCDEVRFDQLQVIHSYAAEKLATYPQEGNLSVGETQKRHAAYFAQYGYGDSWDPQSKRPARDLPNASAEFENILAGCEHALANNWSSSAAYTCRALQLHYLKNGPASEGVAISERVLAREDLSTEESITLRAHLGQLCINTMAYEKAGDIMLSAMLDARREALGNLEARVLHGLANVHINEGNLEAAAGYTRESLKLTRDTANATGEEVALQMLGIIRYLQGSPAQAVDVLGDARKRATTSGNLHGAATACINLGQAYADIEEPSLARQYLEEGLDYTRQTGDKRAEGGCLSILGSVVSQQEEPDDARAIWDEGEKVLGSWGGRFTPELGIIRCRRGLFEVDSGETGVARDCLEDALAIQTRHGLAQTSELGQLVNKLQEALGA